MGIKGPFTTKIKDMKEGHVKTMAEAMKAVEKKLPMCIEKAKEIKQVLKNLAGAMDKNDTEKINEFKNELIKVRSSISESDFRDAYYSMSFFGMLGDSLEWISNEEWADCIVRKDNE